MQLVARRENNGREKKVEEELVVEADAVLDGCAWSHPDGQANDHACACQICGVVGTERDRTSKDGNDRLVDGLYFLKLQDITRE